MTSVNDRGVVLARFVRPPMNYFCAEAAEELAGLIESWKTAEVRAVVLTGDSRHFITHYSVEELSAFAADRETMERVGTALSAGYYDLLRSLRALPKPVIAAINGDCMGGGLELALWCDLRVAQLGDFSLGLPEIHMGIMPGGSATQVVSRMLGTATAIKLIMLGELFSPIQALNHGLVHYAVDDSVGYAISLGDRLSFKSGCAIAQLKSAIYLGSDLPLAEGLAMEASAFLKVMQSPEALVGMNQYLSVARDDRRRWLDQ